MATTPPPLPSSSEDDDYYDDKEFGCFSAPIKTSSNISSPSQNDLPPDNISEHSVITDRSDSVSNNSNSDVMHSTFQLKEASKPASPETEFSVENVLLDSSQNMSKDIRTEKDLSIKQNDTSSDDNPILENRTVTDNKRSSDNDDSDEPISNQSGDIPQRNEKTNDGLGLQTTESEINACNYSNQEDEDEFGDWGAFESEIKDGNEKVSHCDSANNNTESVIQDQKEKDIEFFVTNNSEKEQVELDDEFGEWGDFDSKTKGNDGKLEDESFILNKNTESAHNDGYSGRSNGGNGSDNEDDDYNNREIKDRTKVSNCDNDVEFDAFNENVKNDDENIYDLDYKDTIQGGEELNDGENENICYSNNDAPSNIPIHYSNLSHNEHSNLTDNHDDDFVGEKVKEDDDFGDFADFSSSAQNFEITESNEKDQEGVPPLSFRTGFSEENDNHENESEEFFVCISVNDKTLSGDTKKGENNDFGDDDDAWGFKSAQPSGSNDQGNDDFGNFGSANDDDGNDDWASFGEVKSVPAADNDENEDDFDDFSSSEFQAASSQTVVTPPQEQDRSSKVEKVLSMCFPEVPSNSDLIERNGDVSQLKEAFQIDVLCSVVEIGLKITPQTKEETWTIVKELRNKDPVVGTWGKLKDVNTSHALDIGWSTSHCCQEVFSTLHIDTKNVLFSQKKQAVPFYASGLGILEPIRGQNTPEKGQPPIQPTPALLDTSNNKSEETKKVLDIPPVDFDWGSSGLTNPLKVFKTDGFNTGLSSLEPFTDLINKSAEPPKEISEEAKSILSKIPNLNFMRSKVLMFPIKD